MAAPYDEVMSALAEYFRLGVQNRDWSGLAALFIDDSEYVARGVGRAEGRPAIEAWITAAAEKIPCMTHSIEWSMIDGDSAAFWIWHHLPDPAGTEYGYDAPNLCVLRYAGDGRWRTAETFANPEELDLAISDWVAAGGTPDMAPDHSLAAAAPSHPPVPSPPPDRAVLEAVCDALVTENWLDLIDTSGADWHDHGGHGILRWAEGERVERCRILHGSRAVIVLDSPVPAALVAHVNEAGRITYLDHVYAPQESAQLSSTS